MYWNERINTNLKITEENSKFFQIYVPITAFDVRDIWRDSGSGSHYITIGSFLERLFPLFMTI